MSVCFNDCLIYRVVSFISGRGTFDTEREGIWMSASDELSVADSYLMKFQRETLFLCLIYAKQSNIFKIVVQGVLEGIFGTRSTA
jgi:hypothetical protein